MILRHVSLFIRAESLLYGIENFINQSVYLILIWVSLFYLAKWFQKIESPIYSLSVLFLFDISFTILLPSQLGL